MRYFIKIAISFIIVLVFGLAHAQQNTGLRYIESENVASLNPYENNSLRMVNIRFHEFIFESLFRYDYNREEFLPVLAMDYSVIDGYTYDVKLKENVFWHDGERLTADDVVFTFNYAKNESNLRSLSMFFNNTISEVNKINDYTVRFSFFNPNLGENLMSLTYWILPEHLLSDGPAARREFARRPIGTGPFEFRQITIQGTGRLVRNDRYHGKVPNINDVRMDVLPDFDTATLRMRDGQSDLLVNTPISRVEEFERTHRLEPFQSYNVHAIGINFENPLLHNRNLRRALVYGFDRRRSLNQWFDGRGSVLAGPFTSSSPNYNPSLQLMEYDVDRAKELLRRAGFTTDRQGRTLDHDGNPIKLNLLVKQQLVSGMSNVIQDFIEQMKAIGIDVNAQFEISERYERRLYFEKDFDLALMEWVINPVYDISHLFISDNIYPGGHNIMSYKNSQIDELFEEYRNTDATRRLRRSQIMYDIQNILATDVPCIFLFNFDQYAVFSNRFSYTLIDPFAFFTFVNEWEVLDYYE